MAVVQGKQERLIRALEVSQVSERGQQQRLNEMEEEMRDLSSTCRARIRYLERAATEATRRVEKLFRQLQVRDLILK